MNTANDQGQRGGEAEARLRNARRNEGELQVGKRQLFVLVGVALSFSDGQYSYVWKTVKAWAGTCRQFSVKLVDGTTHVANFSFR